ncbi:hypothetical protein GC209_13950 [bacterium]|nr:hypothetical protein [bacterium]
MSKKTIIPFATKARGKSGAWTVHADAYPMVRSMRANGCAKASIAAALGMPASTFKDVLERDEALADAYGEGNAAMHDELVGLLMQQARDGYAPAAMFLLKSAHGYRENTPVAAPDQRTVNILIPPAATADELAKLTAAMRDITPQPATPEPAPFGRPANRKALFV